jgi:hypothetical protein
MLETLVLLMVPGYFLLSSAGAAVGSWGLFTKVAGVRRAGCQHVSLVRCLRSVGPEVRQRDRDFA